MLARNNHDVVKQLKLRQTGVFRNKNKKLEFFKNKYMTRERSMRSM